LDAVKETIDLALAYKEEGNAYVVGVELSGHPDQGEFSAVREELKRG